MFGRLDFLLSISYHGIFFGVLQTSVEYNFLGVGNRYLWIFRVYTKAKLNNIVTTDFFKKIVV